MSKLTQKEAVFNAVTNVVGGFDSTQAVTLSKEQRAQVNHILFEGFKAGTIELEKTFTDSELKTYVSGLQSNWLRKDSRLNGGTKYQAKNPGSRAGSADPQVRAMRALLKTKSDPVEQAEIQGFISKRLAEIKPAKAAAAAPAVNAEDLPEELRHLLS